MAEVYPDAPLFLADGPEAITNPVGIEVGAAYTIIGPDGSRAVLNDTADRDFVGFLAGDNAVTGLERAAVRESADALAEADGGVHGAFRYDRLAFTLQGIIPPTADRGGTWQMRQAKLLRATNAMRGDALLQWKPSESVPLQVSFRQAQPTRISGRRPKTFIVAGVSEQPCAFAQTLAMQAFAPGVQQVGGFASPISSPIGSSSSQAGQITVTTAGSFEAWPTITVTGPITNPTITNATIGRTLNLDYSLAGGEYLAIDTDPRLRAIKLNGQASRYSALDWTVSTWWPLAPGANDIRVGAASYSTGASFAIAWRDAFG